MRTSLHRDSQAEQSSLLFGPFQVVRNLTEMIQQQSLGWSARPMEKWTGLSMLQVNSYAGIKRENRVGQMLRQHGASYRSLEKKRARSFLQTGSSLRALPKLPDSWDWSDVNGRSFLEPVMDQSECGSCYVASAMRMLTARHKINQNDTNVLPWHPGRDATVFLHSPPLPRTLAQRQRDT